jgi:hypothetical protein
MILYFCYKNDLIENFLNMPIKKRKIKIIIKNYLYVLNKVYLNIFTFYNFKAFFPGLFIIKLFHLSFFDKFSI